MPKLANWFLKLREIVEPEIAAVEKEFEAFDFVKKEGKDSKQKQDQKAAKKEKAKEKSAAEKEEKKAGDQSKFDFCFLFKKLINLF